MNVNQKINIRSFFPRFEGQNRILAPYRSKLRLVVDMPHHWYHTPKHIVFLSKF